MVKKRIMNYNKRMITSKKNKTKINTMMDVSSNKSKMKSMKTTNFKIKMLSAD